MQRNVQIYTTVFKMFSMYGWGRLGGQELSISKILGCGRFMTYSKQILLSFDLYLGTVNIFPSLLLYLFIYQGKSVPC